MFARVCLVTLLVVVSTACGSSSKHQPGDTNGDTDTSGDPGPGGDNGGDPSVTQSITVAGTVVLHYGLPAVDTTLTIWGTGAAEPSTFAATTGSFSFSDIVPPYDIMVTNPGGSNILYLGLTRPDPLLVAIADANDPPANGSTVSGTIAGPVGGSGQTNTLEDFDCGTASVFNYALGDASYSLALLGVPGTNLQCSGKMMRFSTNANQLSPTYIGYDQHAVVFTGTTASQNFDLTFDALVGHDIALTITAQEGQPNTGADLQWLVDDKRVQSIADVISAVTTPTTVTIPTDTRIQTSLIVQSARASINRVLSPSMATLDITIPPQPELTHPSGVTTNFDMATETFTVSGLDGATFEYVVVPDGSQIGTIVISASSSLPGSVFAAHGVPLAAGTSYDVIVVGLTATHTTDDFASALGTERGGAGVDGAIIGQTSVQNFSTAN